MKTLSLLVALMCTVCLIGCEDPELVTCQQENQALQSQLEQANTTVAEKDAQIEEMKSENIEIQTKAMESIQTVMAKQAEKDNKIKQKIVERARENQILKEKVASLKAQIDAHVCVIPEELDHDDEADDHEGHDHGDNEHPGT
ncbi:MAG: hypothetical protein ACYSOP_02150 [Planctomycetota bacterium]|jgi:phage I-like protein